MHRLLILLFGLFTWRAGAALTPVFDYRFPASYAGDSDGAPVTDQSAAGNDGVISSLSGEPAPLSEDVPAGAAAGTRSLDLAFTEGASLKTDATLVLNRETVVSSGGFTMEIWFKGALPGGLIKIMDYAGTEFIGLRPADSDGDGNAGEVVLGINSAAGQYVSLDTDDGFKPDEWNHIIYAFEVTDGSNPAAIAGNIIAILNGRAAVFPGKTLTDFGDTLNRPLSVGSHAVAGENFLGLVYNPALYMGISPLEQPTMMLVTGDEEGFSATLKDGQAAVIAPAAITATLNGTAVALETSKAGDTTTLTHTPAAPLPGGVYTVVFNYTDAAAKAYSNTFNFNITGSDFTPVFVYRLPASYDGAGGNTSVTDLSPAGNTATVTVSTGGEALLLGDDVPPGAAAGTKSLDLTEVNGYFKSDETLLLNRPGILAAGGFTMDVWFKGGFPDVMTKVIDYAGTEYIGVRAGDTDQDGNAGEVIFCLNSDANQMILDADDGLLPEAWNHITCTFTVTNGTLLNALAGNVTITLNGNVRTFNGLTLTSFGDDLNRSINVGSHPGGGELYQGLIYNPAVYFGINPAAQPAVTFQASRDNGITVSIEDADGAVVNTPSIAFTLDGAPVPVTPVKEDETTAFQFTPAIPLAGGQHSARLSFTDAAGGIYYLVRNFPILGSATVPVFAYRFPDSYDETGETALDLSTAENNSIVSGRNEGQMIALSDDVPAGAAAGTKSLDLTTTQGILYTEKNSLLKRANVVAAGGFTMDVWFKGEFPDVMTKIMDYAGTESIGVRSADTDGDGNAGEVLAILNSDPANNSLILDEDDGLSLDGWNHIIFTFQVLDESNPAALEGNIIVNLNGVTTISEGHSLSTFGDDLNRPFGIASHPLRGEYYTGLIYSPALSLGVPSTGGGDTPAISVSRDGNTLRIQFTGVLQSSESLTGFQDVPNAASPYSIPLPAAGRMFFRARN